MPQVTIAASSHNLPQSTAVFGGAAEYQRFAVESGYAPGTYTVAPSEVSPPDPDLQEDGVTYHGGGFEWSAVRNPHNLLGATAIGPQLAKDGFVSTLHQSWRSTTVGHILGRLRSKNRQGSWNGRPNTIKNVVRGLLLAAVIPPLDAWTETLGPVQTAAGHRLPVVAYPNEQQPPERHRFLEDYLKVGEQFGPLRHQPTAETLAAWGLLDPDTTGSKDATAQMVTAMRGAQQAHGFSGVAADTKHIRSVREGFRIEDPVEFFRQLARHGMLDEIHLNLTDDSKSVGEILAGNLAETPHGELLAAAFGALAAQDQVLVVVEAPAAVFKRAGKRGRRSVVAANKQVVESVARLAASLR